MWVFAHSAIRAGIRSRSFIALLILGLLGMGLVLFTSLFSGRHPATLALDIGLSVVRGVGILMVLFWTQDLLSREVDRKAVLFSLAYPVSRASYLLGHYMGIIALAALGVLILAVQMRLAIYLAHIDYAQPWPTNTGWPLVVTLIYIWIELALVAAVATALSAVSTTPFLPFALGAIFAVCAKSIGPVLDYVRISQQSDPRLFERMHSTLEAIRWLLPDTSRLDLRIAPLYNQPLDWPSMLGAGLLALTYAALALALAWFYFDRREFSK